MDGRQSNKLLLLKWPMHPVCVYCNSMKGIRYPPALMALVSLSFMPWIRELKKYIYGIGGSATVDGGCGILQALGFRFLNPAGDVLRQLPSDPEELSSVDETAVDARIRQCEFSVLVM